MSEVPKNPRGLQVICALEEAALQWLDEAKLPSLGQVLAEGQLRPGVFFTHLGPFTGKGIVDAASRVANGRQVIRPSLLYAKLNSFIEDGRIEMQIHPENLTSVSAPGEMSGLKRLFVAGRLTEAELPLLRAQAYVIGHLHDEPRGRGINADPLGRLPWQMEIFCTQIDQFSKMKDVKNPTIKELERLKDVPEQEIKHAFAEIIGESYVPKDWAGERSDLFSTRITVENRELAAAIAFKDPPSSRR